MTGKKILLVLICLILTAVSSSAAAGQDLAVDPEKEKYHAANNILDRFYNHLESLEENRTAERAAWELIQKYPDDPYIYDLWASIEVVLISHEVGVKIGKSGINLLREHPQYKKRADTYYETIDRAIILTNGRNDSKFLFAKAILFFDKAKFSVKFDGLLRSDHESALGFHELGKILDELKDFCPAFFFIGGTAYLMSSQSSWKKVGIWLKSKAYGVLSEDIGTDPFDKNLAMSHLEKVYNCGYQELWYKKTWLESGFALANAYKDLRRNISTAEEKIILAKEIALLKNMTALLPNNKDLAEKLALAEIRIKF